MSLLIPLSEATRGKKLSINKTFCTFLPNTHKSKLQQALQILPLLIYICMTS